MRAYAHNETIQILRDPVRLAFAFVGSALLMLVFGFGITTDVEHIRYASLDLDLSPESRTYLEQFAGSPRYFTRHRAGRSAERRSLAAAVGRRLGGPGDPPELRPRCPPGLRAGGAGAGGRRDDVPWRHRRAVRPGGARERTERPDLGLRAATPRSRQGRHRRTLHVQPDVRERLLDRAEHPRSAAAPHSVDSHGRQHRAREGAGLDHQLLRHADGPARIPRRQAAAVRRHRDGQLRHPHDPGARRLRRPGQGQLPDADAVHVALRRRRRPASAWSPRRSPAARSRPSSSRRS